ncbi:MULTISPECIES: hypothetical protein [unclassified Methanoculleus]|jgi:hypothetical protein|uniref:hypothetical protein n=1 Tax=unclassified Methanoculleus TaxID=2619537 RepID=UPI0025E50C22|nr:hypothetical protein [Methanoculleus sp. UBA377]
MDEFDGVLVMLMAAGGRIAGRTTIQKLGYFSTIPEVIQAHYRPHYYGPYSADIAGAIQALVSYGFIEERVEMPDAPGSASTPDWKRYTYSLTGDGEKLVRRLKEEHPSEALEIEEIVGVCRDTANLDSRVLSWAAKVHYIRTREKRDMPHDEIREIARTLNWDLTEEQIGRGVALLKNLHFA